jgi:hypothetical protein
MIINASRYILFFILASLTETQHLGTETPTASPPGMPQDRSCELGNLCPKGQICGYKLDISEPNCLRKGTCITYGEKLRPAPPIPYQSPLPKLNYSSCGGFRSQPDKCFSPMVCIDNPYLISAGACGMACDASGICVRLNETCSGASSTECSGGKKCFAHHRESYCHPTRGGSDCEWFCI